MTAAPNNVTITAGVAKWLAEGEHGVSSQQIVAHLCGLETRGRWAFKQSCWPRDPDDLRRCLLLTDVYAPELGARIHEMAALGPEWAALSSRWSELRELLTSEGDWRGRDCGWAPRTYERMRELIDGART